MRRHSGARYLQQKEWNRWNYFSHVIRKPVYATCEQQKCRSACASAQSDHCLCCLLPRQYNISGFYIRNFKPLASFCDCAGRFESNQVKNPKDRFSHDKAHFNLHYRNKKVYLPENTLNEPAHEIMAQLSSVNSFFKCTCPAIQRG